jgi:hypothetical protein
VAPETARGARPASIALAVACDALLVGLFAGLGRSEHARAAGLAIMWIAATVWKRPFAVARSGIPIWVGTVAIGMLLRALTGAGTALPFVIVATITLGAFLLGWRALVALIAKLRRA